MKSLNVITFLSVFSDLNNYIFKNNLCTKNLVHVLRNDILIIRVLYNAICDKQLSWPSG